MDPLSLSVCLRRAVNVRKVRNELGQGQSEAQRRRLICNQTNQGIQFGITLCGNNIGVAADVSVEIINSRDAANKVGLCRSYLRQIKLCWHVNFKLRRIFDVIWQSLANCSSCSPIPAPAREGNASYHWHGSRNDIRRNIPTWILKWAFHEYYYNRQG